MSITSSREYRTWWDMMHRCLDKKHKWYSKYGERGISVNKRWHKFENFYKDMGNKPIGTSLDRIDNNKGYSNKNCRWTSFQKNSNNRAVTKYITFNKKIKPLTEWAELYNIPADTLYRRVFKLGWKISKALKCPVRGMRFIKSRRTVYVRYKGASVSVKDLANEYGYKYTTLWGRLKHGWSPTKAVTTPLRSELKWH